MITCHWPLSGSWLNNQYSRQFTTWPFWELSLGWKTKPPLTRSFQADGSRQQTNTLPAGGKQRTHLVQGYVYDIRKSTHSVVFVHIWYISTLSMIYHVQYRCIILYTFNCNLDTRHASEMQEIHLQCIANHVKPKQLKNNAPCWISFHCLSQKFATCEVGSVRRS